MAWIGALRDARAHLTETPARSTRVGPPAFAGHRARGLPFSLAILKMIGILLSDSPVQARTAMAKVVGFDAMWLLLAPFPVTADVCDVLLGLGRRPGRSETSMRVLAIDGH